ncbi:tRNA-splicing endonuclease subunit Sen15 [Penicillium bovifimosum]|uniref:tRNA-splicing endonuclease subunit Sen15 n=1 Tax=Penicillium bovifimosum TaxID=126998 RepID=A0A9W9L087_9EURO|nr:tRNA-splicing endonuclease subunit Sen15 [Penicillium bovifimosum]KAJ5130938.1 tRNA-splicing endonuclease subunit Sen15 [Penicillium bovifimosum]
MANTQTTNRPNASALTSHIADKGHEAPHLAAAAQVQHNLQYQHLWTSIVGYTISGEAENTNTSGQDPQRPPQTPIALLSGYPPHRVYTHPDEQLYMLENGIREDDLEPERMFVVPLVQGQSWTLRHMAAVFDRLREFELKVEEHDRSVDTRTKHEEETDSDMAEKLARYYKKKEQARLTAEWGSQRLLIAMVDKGMGGDGTVAYYVLHEGEVKPRQN